MSPLSYPLSWGSQTFVMGILNITPDSFSGDGLIQDDDWISNAVLLAQSFVKGGAQIIDIGGESTRPGAQTVSAQEELERVVPVVEALVKEKVDAILSVDTYKAEVAEAALKAGAHWVNDVWGLRADEKMAEVVARYGVPVILMHNRSKSIQAELKERLGGRYVGVEYQNLIEDIRAELLSSIAIAQEAGIPDRHIILDPGIGFGKTVKQNLDLLNRLGELCDLGYPLLVGSSRKSFIGYTLDLSPDQRLEGTAATVAVSIVRGADIIRVHDVEFMARVAKMTDAIVRQK